MSEINKICICGGGGLGHTCAAVLSSNSNLEVMMYTKHPEMWNHEFIVEDDNGKCIQGHLSIISNLPQEVIPQADLVLLCLPAFLVQSTLITIKPFLSKNAIVGSVVGNTGFFIFAHQILHNTSIGLFAFQRVPYISRVIEYGQKAALLGYKEELLMAVENIQKIHEFSQCISSMFCTPTKIVDSFYEVTLSNSNPILHTGRLYSMWKDWQGQVYAQNPLFYHDWTDDASQILLEMDKEFFDLLHVLGVNSRNIRTLLEHYGVSNAVALTQKLKSIPSFANILSPMQCVDNGWIPDINSRYFTEDFPFGLRFIYELAHQHNSPCPTIDRVYHWGINLIEKTHERLTC